MPCKRKRVASSPPTKIDTTRADAADGGAIIKELQTVYNTVNFSDPSELEKLRTNETEYV